MISEEEQIASRKMENGKSGYENITIEKHFRRVNNTNTYKNNK